MSATQYTPGEHAEEIFVDASGNRFDSKGNPITVGEQDYNPRGVAYRTERGQVLRYADVYPGPVNVHQNVPLSDFAVAWELTPGMFISPELAPVKTVTKRSDTFYKIGSQGKEVVRTPSDESDIRAVGATANEVQNVFDTDTYTVTNYSYRDFLPDEVADNADEVLTLSQSITQFLTTRLEYRWDYRTITALTSTSNFSNTTFAGASTAGKYIKDATSAARYINAAMNYAKAQVNSSNLMQMPTHVLMGLDVAQAIQASPEIAAQVVYGLGQKYIEDGGWGGNNYGLPEKLNGLKVVVAPHIQNTAKKGQTSSFSGILTNTMAFVHVGAPSRRTLNAYTTFRKGGLNVRTYRDEGRRGTFIEVEMIQSEKLTNASGGYVLTACIS